MLGSAEAPPLGPMLAEGGEGRVYEVAGRIDRVYKAYRGPVDLTDLQALARWDTSLPRAAADRVGASTAWPLEVVADARRSTTAGLVLPRAPRRFSLRHRDGGVHLATLSYLAAEPLGRAEAYGITLPLAGSAERFGLVYALARLIEAFESASPSVVHGDLSAKNVLWSLARGPEVFVLDCDNAERYGEDGGLGTSGRRRAMTPNWDDPAVPPGGRPGPGADRYSLALIFLRVVGAAHFPVQRRQKQGESLLLDVELPAAFQRLRGLAPGAMIWDLCARGLSMHPDARPPAAAWVEALADALTGLGATRYIDSVAAIQGSEPLPGGDLAPLGTAPGDVRVRPVPAVARRRPVRRMAPTGRVSSGGVASTASLGLGGRRGGRVPLAVPGITPAAVPPVAPARPPATPGLSLRAQIRRVLGPVIAWLAGEHRRAFDDLRTPGRRASGAIRLPWCVALDLAVATVCLFVVGMVAGPFLGI